MRLLILGDTHGNIDWVCKAAIPYAVEQRCDKIIQVGDFGFVFPHGTAATGSRTWRRGIQKLNLVLARHGIDLHFLPGNHEDHSLLSQLYAEGKRSPEGHAHLAGHILYTGRWSGWSWSGVRLGAVGGAVSVDQHLRVSEARRTGQVTWWPEEILDPEEIIAARQLGQVDLLFTHDGPSGMPMVDLKPDLASTAHRQVVTSVGRALRPHRWWHGHYHVQAGYDFWHDDGRCDVLCLDRDQSDRTEGMEVVDLATVGI